MTRAYDVLREAGYLASRQGSGSVATLPSGAHPRGTGALFPADVATGVIDLTCAATRAPGGIVEAYERAVAQLPAYLTGAGYLAFGVPELRETIARRYRDRGLPTCADDVLVTSGAVAGLGVVARALLGPGDRVARRGPRRTRTPSTASGPRRAAPDDAGRPRRLGRRGVGTCGASASARVAVLIPDFHNPTGALMPDEARAVLAQRLGAAGTTPVIDETVAEVDLEGGAAPLPFAAHAPGAIPSGAPRSRTGAACGPAGSGRPRGTLRPLVESRVTSDLGAPVLEQLVLVELMRHSPGLTAERRTDLVAARRRARRCPGASELPELRFRLPRGGLSLWCGLPDGLGRRPSRRRPRPRGCSWPPVRVSRWTVASTGGSASRTSSGRRR